jgi:hypothetical protein
MVQFFTNHIAVTARQETITANISKACKWKMKCSAPTEENLQSLQSHFKNNEFDYADRLLEVDTKRLACFIPAVIFYNNCSFKWSN